VGNQSLAEDGADLCERRRALYLGPDPLGAMSALPPKADIQIRPAGLTSQARVPDG